MPNTAANAEKISAVILTNRQEIRTALRDELKRIGLKSEQIFTVTTGTEIEAKIHSLKGAILILDWDAGVELVLGALDVNRRLNKQDTHMVFLITSKIDDKIVAIATEYQASKIHSGEITAQQIRETLRSLYREATNLSPIRRLLIQVGDLRKAKNFQGVHDLLKPIHEKLPDNSRIAVEYGENLFELQQYGEAEKVLLAAASIDPPYPRAKHVLARVYLKLQEPDKAIQCLRGAQILSPYNIHRLMEMGHLFLDINRPKDAKHAFDEALQIAPGFKDSALGKGEAMLRMGEVNEALSLIKESGTTKDLAAIFNTSAIFAIKAQEFDKALSLYHTALEACGKNRKVEARLWYNMGLGQFKKGDYEESLHSFKKSTELDPKFEDAKHNLETLQKVSNLSEKKPRKAKKAKAAPAVQKAVNAPPTIDFKEFEETLGAENLSQSLGDLNFDLDFDEDLMDD